MLEGFTWSPDRKKAWGQWFSLSLHCAKWSYSHKASNELQQSPSPTHKILSRCRCWKTLHYSLLLTRGCAILIHVCANKRVVVLESNKVEGRAVGEHVWPLKQRETSIITFSRLTPSSSTWWTHFKTMSQVTEMPFIQSLSKKTFMGDDLALKLVTNHKFYWFKNSLDKKLDAIVILTTVLATGPPIMLVLSTHISLSINHKHESDTHLMAMFLSQLRCPYQSQILLKTLAAPCQSMD